MSSRKNINSDRVSWKGSLLALALIAGLAMLAIVQTQPMETAATTPDPPAPGSDRDGDGVPDAVERFLGTNPDHRDTDGDGWTDGEEIALRRSPVVADPVTPTRTTGIRVEILPDAGNRSVGLFIVAKTDSSARLASTAICLAHNLSASDFDEHVDTDLPPDEMPTAAALIPQVIEDRTDHFLQLGHRLRVREDGLLSLYIPTVPYDAVPRRIGILALVEDETGHVEADLEYIGNRNGFYQLAFGASQGGQVHATHVYHVVNGITEDTGQLDENEDCKQYASPISTPPTVYVITREQCESRAAYFCPPDCGIDTGRIIVKL